MLVQEIDPSEHFDTKFVDLRQVILEIRLKSGHSDPENFEHCGPLQRDIIIKKYSWSKLRTPNTTNKDPRYFEIQKWGKNKTPLCRYCLAILGICSVVYFKLRHKASSLAESNVLGSLICNQ